MSENLLVSIKDEKLYTAQLVPYHGKVRADIICHHDSMYDVGTKLWLTSMHKSFGSMWNSAPREKDWIAAKKWAEEQLDLISKHGTNVVAKPQYLRDQEEMARQRKNSEY